jgi:diguanylate cyclase (GGDEF)-like protein/PAS domain S-box-containing protein
MPALRRVVRLASYPAMSAKLHTYFLLGTQLILIREAAVSDSSPDQQQGVFASETGKAGTADGSDTGQSGPSSQAGEALDFIGGMVAAIEQTPLAAVRSIDRTGRVCFWNNTSAQLYETTAHAALGQPLQELLDYGGQSADYALAVETLWQTGQPCAPRDWQVSLASGKQLWIHSTMFPVLKANRPHRVFCMDIDITLRKQAEREAAQAGGSFRQLYHQSADAIMLLEDGRIVDANPAAVALFGFQSQQQVLGRLLTDFSPLQQSGGESSALQYTSRSAQAHEAGNCRYEWHYLHTNGELCWAEVLLTATAGYDKSMLCAVLRDITERKRTERSLYVAAQVFENARDAIMIMDARRQIISVNRAFAQITSLAVAEGAGHGPAHPFHLYSSGASGVAPDQLLSEKVWSEVLASDYWQGEIWTMRQNGQLYPAWFSLAAIRDSNGEVSNYMGMLSDLTDRKKLEAQTRHLAEHDYLTDLPNRVLLLDRLCLALAVARRRHSMLALLFLDLDHFKSVNDTMGHHVGDMLLKEVARRLTHCVRGVDTVSRQGGDEFVIILAEIGGVDHAAHVASTVLNAVSQVYRLAEYELHISTSIGVSIFPSDGDDIDKLIKNADIAMYHAKQGGRGSFQFFDAEMNARVIERISFENGLRHALNNDEFVLEYQPEVDIASGGMVGAEALIRWRHPELGLLPPQRFIAVAEACGLMVPIGNWVLHRACHQARRWLDAGQPMMVAVNLSTGQFMQKNLVQSVQEALNAAGLPPHLLELEITESTLMKGGGNALEMLARLRQMGLKLTIDDFGTGYSRLGHLRNYPVQKLKIDQSFMADVTGDPDGGATVATIIAMARRLKITVIAEGVETADQLQFLRSEGCDAYQGFFASSALLGSELNSLLE